jgi:large subunit ribosomal protein L17
MNKKNGVKKLGKSADQRRALVKSQVKDLIDRGYIRTTKQRAKVVVKVLNQLVSMVLDKRMKQVTEYLMSPSLERKLEKINFGERKTGVASMTTIKNRPGDNAEVVLVEILKA